jgi:hypothetical protein
MTEQRAAMAPMTLLADLEDLWCCLDELFASAPAWQALDLRRRAISPGVLRPLCRGLSN